MDPELSPEDRAFRDGFRRWLRTHRPRAWRRGPHGQEPAAGEDPGTALDLLGPSGALAQRGLGLPRGA